ncbi:MAG: AmmeMemoRadiSam system protein B [Tepidanaerobacteraceae bacterium]|nr:AmmeMemoRadiSam system protein B [Tepidanaerobacteraceae bacterium]
MKKLTVFFAILCFAVALASIAPGARGTRSLENPQTYETPRATHPNNFFDPRYFNPKILNEKENSSGRICGAVVPHHLLAHRLIAEVFARLQKNPPSLLILLGPNHYNRGARILTSSLGWQTPFGTVEVDEGIIQQMLETQMVKVDDYAFAEEHSIGNLMPFVKYYLPRTKVVPIIFHYDVSKKEAALMAEYLSSLVEDDGVIIASVDFSHYLTRQEAEEKDRETLKVMEEGNLDTLFTMGNDHLDSPAALGTLFLAMENLGIQDFNLLDHTNSGILMGNDMIETTSYMTMLFQKQDEGK